MKRRCFLGAVTIITSGLAGCGQFGLSSVTGGNETAPNRREFGGLTDGIAAVEWENDGQLRVEATEDSNWQGAVINNSAQDLEWLASGNKSPTDESVTLDPLGYPDTVLPQEHDLKILDRQIENLEIGEIDWLESVTLNFSAEFEASAEYNAASNGIELTIDNTGPCAIRLQSLDVTAADTSTTTELAENVTPGQSATFSVEQPWGENQYECALEGQSVTGTVNATPATESDIEFVVDVPSEETCDGGSTINL